MRSVKTIIVSILFGACVIMGQSVSKTGTTAAQFLKLGVGSRSIAVGGAFTAISTDASALYWNPSGISQIKKSQFMFDHTDWILNIDLDFVGLTVPLNHFGTLGLALTYLHMGEMEVTTTHDPEGTDEKFSAASYSGQLSFGKNLTDRFSLGLSLKYIQEDIYNSSAKGMALDVGTLYKTQLEGLTMGMSISNYGSKMQMRGRDLLIQSEIDPSLESDPTNINAHFSTDRFDLPLIFRFGLAWTKSFASSYELTLAVDALHPNDNTESLNVGIETSYNKIAFLRAGYKNLFQRDSQEGLTFGAGVHLNIGPTQYTIDYTYADFGLLGSTQKVTLAIVI